MAEGFYETPEHAELFDTPEEAALAGWLATPNANARVIEVRQEVDGPHVVQVVVQTDGPNDFHDRDYVTCCETSDGQWWESSSNG